MTPEGRSSHVTKLGARGETCHHPSGAGPAGEPALILLSRPRRRLSGRKRRVCAAPGASSSSPLLPPLEHNTRPFPSYSHACGFGSTEQREGFILLFPPIVVRASAGRLVMLFYAGALAMVLLSIDLNTRVLFCYQLHHCAHHHLPVPLCRIPSLPTGVSSVRCDANGTPGHPAPGRTSRLPGHRALNPRCRPGLLPLFLSLEAEALPKAGRRLARHARHSLGTQPAVTALGLSDLYPPKVVPVL